MLMKMLMMIMIMYCSMVTCRGEFFVFPIEGGPPVAQPRIWARKVFTHMITNHDDDSHCHDYDTMIITDSMVISDIFILVQLKILIQNLNK